MKKGDMDDRVANEFLDQAVAAFLDGGYAIRNASATAIRRFMQHSEENAFRVCRRVEGMKDSAVQEEQMLYNLVKDEIPD